MRKALVALVVVAAVVCLGSVAGAVDQKNTGCGLGSIAFEGKNGLVSQTFAVTTNGTFGNQTFGITSGTSNCEQYKTFAANEKLNTFVADNMDSLAKDIAKGEGEYLDTMASLMDVNQAERPQLYSALQKNFSRIYSSPSVTPAEVVANIGEVTSSM
jgi:hypothetical protein